jgi:histidine triad (HIT) family protein
MFKMINCRFCKREGEHILHETENTISILSNPYLVKGHTLVMPKEHYEKLLELPKSILNELIDEVVYIEELLGERLNSPGCDIRQNYRPFLEDSKLKVSRLHFHVLPRFLEDELYLKSMISEKEIFRNLNSELVKSLMNKLNNN